MFATSDSGPLFFQLAVSAKRGKRGFEVLTAAMSASRITSNLLVGIVGLEPTRPLGHQILSLTRLPIPSYPQIERISGCAPPQQLHWSGFHFWLKPLTNKSPSILAPDDRAVRLSWRTTCESVSGSHITSQLRLEVLVLVQTSSQHCGKNLQMTIL